MVKGKTPLYCGLPKGHLEVVKALSGAEAEVNKADNQDMTPLYCGLL
jgi:ankyrin repeat protein